MAYKEHTDQLYYFCRGNTSLAVYNKMLPFPESRSFELFDEKNSRMKFVIREGKDNVSFSASVREAVILSKGKRNEYMFSHIYGNDTEKDGIFKGLSLTSRLYIRKNGQVLVRISTGYAQARKETSGAFEEVEGTFRETDSKAISLPEDDFDYMLFKLIRSIDASIRRFESGIRSDDSIKQETSVQPQAHPRAMSERQDLKEDPKEDISSGKNEKDIPLAPPPAPGSRMKRVKYVPLGQFLKNEDGTYNLTFSIGGQEYPVVIKTITQELVEAVKRSTPLSGEIYLGRDGQMHLNQ